MRKRLHDIDIWVQPWYRVLETRHQHLWNWLCDHCDWAGFIEIDWGLASFQMNQKFNEDDLVVFGKSRVVKLGEGRFFLPKFIEFHHAGKLTHCSSPQRGVLESIKRNHLPINPQWEIEWGPNGPDGSAKISIPTPPPPILTAPKPTEDALAAAQRELDNPGDPAEPSKDKAQSRGTREELVAFCKSIGMPGTDGDDLYEKWEGSGWKNNGKPIANWKMTIQNWKRKGYLLSQKEAKDRNPKQANANIKYAPSGTVQMPGGPRTNL